MDCSESQKKRSKKIAESIIPIEGQNNQHPISQEDFEHPQPDSKRISFGLPISNPYLKPKQKQAHSSSKKNHPKNLLPATIDQYLKAETTVRLQQSP